MDLIKNDKFYIDDLSCEDLIAEFGSPLYVYNGQTFRERFDSLANAFDYPKIRIYYACKSNTNLNVLKIFKELGSYVDTVSPGEIFSAIKAGYKSPKILFTPNNPTSEEMKYAISNNVMVTIGSLPIIEEYSKLGGSSDICIRVNPDIGFGLLPEYCRHGYAYEAAKAVMDDTRDGLGFSRVTAIVSPENKASIGLIDKLGLSFVEPMRPPGDASDVLLYAAQFD